MTETVLGKLSTLIDDSAVPEWLKAELDKRREEILAALESNEPFTIKGPDGQEVEIGRTQNSAA